MASAAENAVSLAPRVLHYRLLSPRGRWTPPDSSLCDAGHVSQRRPARCRGSGERTALWVPVDRPVVGDLPAVKKCPYCGESLRLIKKDDGYRFPPHRRPVPESDG